MKTYEIEKRFLIEEIPHHIKIQEVTKIEQYYFCQHEAKTIRVRRKNQKFIMTLKKGKGLIRNEAEFEIDKPTFERIAELCGDAKIVKKRNIVYLDNLKVEIDVFEGRYEGLIIAEIEFKTKEDAENFMPPVWFGKEITDDMTYTNAYLALH